MRFSTVYVRDPRTAVLNRYIKSTYVYMIDSQSQLQTTHSNFQEKLILINLLPKFSSLQLINIPLCPNKSPMQEASLGRRKPDRKLSRKVRYPP